MLKAASAILAAFLLLCGAIILTHPFAGSPGPVTVFDGVSDADLAQFDIVVTDRQPTATPGFSDAGIRQTLSNSPGAIVVSSQVVLVRSAGHSASDSPGRLAWAIRVDTSHVPESVASCTGPSCLFGPGTLFHIMFYDGYSARSLGSYTRFPPGHTDFVGTPVPTP
jgi:hypothetical protein